MNEPLNCLQITWNKPVRSPYLLILWYSDIVHRPGLNSPCQYGIFEYNRGSTLFSLLLLTYLLLSVIVNCYKYSKHWGLYCLVAMCTPAYMNSTHYKKYLREFQRTNVWNCCWVQLQAKGTIYLTWFILLVIPKLAQMFSNKETTRFQRLRERVWRWLKTVVEGGEHWIHCVRHCCTSSLHSRPWHHHTLDLFGRLLVTML